MSRVISREDVHAYSEACSDMGLEFQNIAARLVKGQNRLKTFIDKEFVQVDPLAGQVALYMFTVCLRVFDSAAAFPPLILAVPLAKRGTIKGLFELRTTATTVISFATKCSPAR